MATLSLGTKLRLWDESGNWYYVTTLTGKKGWISKTYIATGYTMTTSASVNLRKSANGETIKKLARGHESERGIDHRQLEQGHGRLHQRIRVQHLPEVNARTKNVGVFGTIQERRPENSSIIKRVSGRYPEGRCSFVL